MRWKFGRAAVFAALLFQASGPAAAQDVALVAREGKIVLSGTLLGFDGEFYRIDTAYGALTVDAQGVICEGPACPDLTAPKATIRITGAPDAGARLLPGLVRAFAEVRGLIYEEAEGPGYEARILDPETRKDLAEISFSPLPPDEAAAALAAGSAELQLSALAVAPSGARAVALDALVPIMAPDNPTPEVSTVELAAALSGQAVNWADLGGPDMPLVLHALGPDTDLGRALDARLGLPIKAQVLHEDMASLAAAVVKDPWALAITGRAEVGAARRLPLTDSCGFPLLPGPMAVKAEDYPLALPLFFLTPKRRLPLMAREFLDFLASPAAETVVARAGFIDRSTERAPMTQDGLRLINAIQGAGDDVTLADLKRLVGVMDGADRFSLTFRFEDGSTRLTPSSQENVAELARLIASGGFAGEALVLAGFSDGSGAAEANLALSLERAARVMDELRAVAPDLKEDQLPTVEGFGEALPMACDETAAGRHLNRRVELWLVPDFTPRGGAVEAPL